MKPIKEIATHFLNLCATGESAQAFYLYAGKSFVHHNAFYKSDATTLMLAMAENAKQHPEKKIFILHILEDGNHVAIHSKVTMYAGHAGIALMHIFRFKHDKIEELWDFGQPVPENMINEKGMF